MSPPYSPSLVADLLASGAPTTADRVLKQKQQAMFIEQLWVTLASVIALLTIVRILRAIHTRIQIYRPMEEESTDEKGVHQSTTQNGNVSLRRFPSAFASIFRIIAFRSTIWLGPGAVMSISEFTFIATYVGLMLMWTFVDTRNLTIMFWEDRAAHIASCQVPLIVALAGKNNLISWLTGVSHEKLNVLHRAAGRTALVLLWVHAMQRYFGGLPAKWSVETAGWMQAGVLGLTALTLAFVMSIRAIRNRAFEFFLVTHIFLIASFIVGGYIHTKYTGYQNYYWPGFVVWGFDRTLRVARLFLNNRGTEASIELLGKDTVRVTMKRRMNWKAGQHAYVVMPSISTLPCEAHPFTIASIPNSTDGKATASGKDVVFLIRGRSGFTSRLRERASSYGTNKVTALIDGPYGCPPNLKQYTTCVLFAGGSGVSYILPLLMDLVYHGRLESSQCRRVLFVWVVRDPLHVKWISAELMKALADAPKNLQIDARIHVTGATDLPSLASSSSDDVETPISSESEKKFFAYPSTVGVQTVYGRPEVSRILEEEITTSSGTVSVDVAGPSALSCAVRRALRSDIARPMGVLKGRAPVVLHTETFGMVKN